MRSALALVGLTVFYKKNWQTAKIILKPFGTLLLYSRMSSGKNTFSLERRCSSRTFRYGYLVTT